jgi:hypothetical protein
MSLLSLLVACCVLAGIVAVVRRPQYAVALLLMMFPLEQLLQCYYSFFLYNPMAINLGVAVLAGIGLTTRLAGGEPITKGYSNGVTFFALALYALTWLNLVQSPVAHEVAQFMTPGLAYFVLMLVMLPMLVADTESFRRILFGFMIAGTTICVLILVNPNASFYAGRLTLDIGAFTTAGRGNPLALAGLGGQIAVVAILYRPQRAGLLVLGLRVAAVLIGLGLAISSGSRGQVMASIFVAMLFFPVARRIANVRQFFAVVFGLGAIAFLFRFLFSTFITSDNSTRWDSSSFSAGMDDRVVQINALLGAWLNHPAQWFFGLGTGFYRSLDTGNLYVHNILVEVLCEQGLFGLGLLGAVLWFAFDAGRKLLALRKDDPELRAAVATLCALSTYDFLLSLKEGSFTAGVGVFMMWFLLAKISRTEQIDAAERAEAERGAAELADAAELEEHESATEPEGVLASSRPG